MLDSMTSEAERWLASFSTALEEGDPASAAALFDECGRWRDILAFTWNIVTLDGRGAVADMLAERLGDVRPATWRLEGPGCPHADGVEGWFTFETSVGRGRGRLRVRHGKCTGLFTAMEELKGHEEPRGPRRPLGVVHGPDRPGETWAEARERETARLGREAQPFVLVVGGGQGGLALGARLRALGVPSLIVEKNARAGDSWRRRYRSLVLHDPVWYDHMPYLPFPDTWPVFTPKDKMGDWLEAYAQIMELPLWTGTSCRRAEREGDRWRVEVEREGETVVLRPAELVFATGAYGPPRRLDLPGADTFRGTLIHSSDYADGRDFAGKRCVVIGAASSGHDVAFDLCQAGAEVTMIQRSPTTVVRSETLMELSFDTYSETALAEGLTHEQADMRSAATPFADFAAEQQDIYRTIRARDADFYARLAATGFALDFGEDESGLMMKALRTGSGYYIDVGCSALIIRGDIAVVSGQGVARLSEEGVILDDGREVPAELVVECTGYQSMHETIAQIASREVADRVGRCWGLGSGVRGDPGPYVGEPLNMWKPTAEEHLWVHGGNLALSRFYSRYLALQLKARLEGIATPVYQRPAPANAEVRTETAE